LVSLTAAVHRLVAARPSPDGSAAARPWPPRLVDLAAATAALAGSLALVSHGGALAHPHTSDLTPSRVALVAVATVPLLAWRRAPLGVFALTASASVALAAFGNVVWPPLGPAVALYLLASGRGGRRTVDAPQRRRRRRPDHRLSGCRSRRGRIPRRPRPARRRGLRGGVARR
jgi:hypothetical protein